MVNLIWTGYYNDQRIIIIIVRGDNGIVII